MHDVATQAVRLAKSLIARGCTVTKFRVSPFGSCYVSVRLHRFKFCVRVADHHGRSPSSNGHLYYLRVDDPSKSTPEPLGSFVRRLYTQETTQDA